MDKPTTINERFVSLINALNKNPNSFSKSIGKTYTAIESICKGRTKPGFDLLESILETYTQVNPNWLLTGSGEMFRNESKVEASSESYLTEHLKTLEENFARLAAQLEAKDRQLEAAGRTVEGLQRTVDALLSRPNIGQTANFLNGTLTEGRIVPLYPVIEKAIA